MRKWALLSALLLIIGSQAPAARKKPHYTFVLPDGYVGWVQIIFNDPDAKALPMRDSGYVIYIPETGIARTSDILVRDVRAKDEFFYRVPTASGTTELRAVPAEDVLPGFSHGGFDIMDTGGKGRGYSWFVFFGPPQVRARVPLADWGKVVDAWYKDHGNYRVSLPDADAYPTPGRMEASAPPKP